MRKGTQIVQKGSDMGLAEVAEQSGLRRPQTGRVGVVSSLPPPSPKPEWREMYPFTGRPEEQALAPLTRLLSGCVTLWCLLSGRDSWRHQLLGGTLKKTGRTPKKGAHTEPGQVQGLTALAGPIHTGEMDSKPSQDELSAIKEMTE